MPFVLVRPICGVFLPLDPSSCPTKPSCSVRSIREQASNTNVFTLFLFRVPDDCCNFFASTIDVKVVSRAVIDSTLRYLRGLATNERLPFFGAET